MKKRYVIGPTLAALVAGSLWFGTLSQRTFSIEGGFSDHPSDLGGATNHGVTVAVARAYGYQGRMTEMPRGVADQIMFAGYWLPVWGDSLAAISDELAWEVFDAGVNAGPRRAVVWLQRCLNANNRQEVDYSNVATDGFMGPATLSAVRGLYDRRPREADHILLRCTNALQGEHFVSIIEARPANGDFGPGWFIHRVQ